MSLLIVEKGTTDNIKFHFHICSYQYGPDTYLLQLRDTNFPVRLREYVKVANRRSPAFAINENNVDYSVSILS